ncbi:hypothetical protein [Adhaeribacter pallidiroseus]|uniref:Uncharacterized protein n=1 Tax=Adhaeribacter pallidiroseus TaxID=2072847 RepID=A0A369QF73_9BACT|nr:hypothetical protein [Adhaeribacter pallidiroseus]RDC62215.1 hypothetical protein AHMF7616_00806 [Adhaeribacter pallidiroseus]
MAATRNITQQIRFLFTAVTLLCVLLLNNQEITTYNLVAPKPISKSGSQLKQSAKKEKTVVKQKVTFEATTSYFVLPLVPFIQWLHPEFSTPVSKIPALLLQPRYFTYFFRILFGFVIIPNAP